MEGVNKRGNEETNGWLQYKNKNDLYVIKVGQKTWLVVEK